MFCKSGQPVKPEDFKNPILEAMDCCFFSKENVILGTKWNHTDSGVTENQTAVEESIYAFDGMLFTKQETMEPDPVTALNNWIKKMYENSVILGPTSLIVSFSVPASCSLISRIIDSFLLCSAIICTRMPAVIQEG